MKEPYMITRLDKWLADKWLAEMPRSGGIVLSDCRFEEYRPMTDIAIAQSRIPQTTRGISENGID